MVEPFDTMRDDAIMWAPDPRDAKIAALTTENAALRAALARAEAADTARDHLAAALETANVAATRPVPKPPADLVEAVARELCRVVGESTDSIGEPGYDWERLDDRGHDLYRTDARRILALVAARQPERAPGALVEWAQNRGHKTWCNVEADHDDPSYGQPCDCGLTAALASTPAPETRWVSDWPRVVTLCGSTRFRAAFVDITRRETMAGRIVLAPGVFGHSGDPLTDEDKRGLDDLHKRKIDMSHEILVLDVGGYVGESTRSEIAYSVETSKPVRYLSHEQPGYAEPTPAPDPFDAADYYTCTDPEVLHAESPEEAIQEHLEMWMSPGCDTVATIAGHCPLTVRAFARMKVAPHWIARQAKLMLDTACEQWSEEYGGDDGNYDNEPSPTEIAACLPDAVALLTKLYADSVPYQCEVSAERVYSAAEVEALLRVECPEWFEDEETST
jgi:hypothetical protein